MPQRPERDGAETGVPRWRVFPSPHGFWTWQDRHDWNSVANFIPPWHGCCDWTPIIAVTFEQSDLVSSLFYNPIHLFSPHPDLAVTNLLRWKGTTLLHRLKSSWETEALRAPRGSDHIPVSPWTIVTTTILLEFPFTDTPLLPALGLTTPPRTSSFHGRHGSSNQLLCPPHGASCHLIRTPRPSECHLGISDGTPLCCLR